MKKMIEKNDVTSATKNFGGLYILIMIIALYITDIISDAKDYSLNELTTMRVIIIFFTILISSFLLTRCVIKKYSITKSFKDNLRFNINLVIIGIAVISIFYFLITLNGNVKKIRQSNEYKVASIYLNENEMEQVIDKVKSEARGAFVKIWVSILIASGISVGLEGKIINKYCLEDEKIVEENPEEKI